MKNNKIAQSLILVTQFGINMIVPILLCTWIGVWLDRRFDMGWAVVLLFFVGAIAGAQNVYRMAKKIMNQKNDRDEKYAKKDK